MKKFLEAHSVNCMIQCVIAFMLIVTFCVLLALSFVYNRPMEATIVAVFMPILQHYFPTKTSGENEKPVIDTVAEPEDTDT